MVKFLCFDGFDSKNSSWENDEDFKMDASASANDDEDNLYTVWEFLLAQLDFTERMILLALTCIICVLGVIGNVLTVVVAFTR